MAGLHPDRLVDRQLLGSVGAYDAAAFESSAVRGSAVEELMVCGLFAGGKRIRTVGPASRRDGLFAAPIEIVSRPGSGNCENDGGTTSSNPAWSSGESVSPVDNRAAREMSRAFAALCAWVGT
jgi:hypothetical protein